MAFSSVILSYFLVAGGTFLTTLLAGKLGVQNEYLGYIIMAAGAFLGGFIAARASHGSTIIEPALGAVLMVASLFGLGLAASNEAGRGILLLPGSVKGLALVAAASGGGGIAGAFLSEKLFGQSATSSAPWIIYAALATFGAGVLGSIFGGVLGKGETVPLLGVTAAFCLLVGVAAGASAKERPLIASLLGGAIGIFAFFYLAVVLIMALFGALGSKEAEAGIPSEAYAGMGILAAGGGIVTMIGALIGWGAVGKKNA